MVDLHHSPGRDAFRLSPEAFAAALFLKYGLLVIYGIHAAIVEVPSFVAVGGPVFATLWAIIVCFFAGLALIGVYRSWMTNKTTFEKWTTGSLILAFLTYSIVLVIRSIDTESGATSALAWVPLALVILPIIRFYSLTDR